MKKIMILFFSAFFLFSLAFTANATVILSPTGVTQNTFGERNSAVGIDNVMNQSGLSDNFISGVTDFDVFFGTPIHSMAALGNEWFGPGLHGTIDFDLGGLYTVDRIALWNEDAYGISSFSAYADIDVNFGSSTLLGSFTPTDHGWGDDYLADIFSFTELDARFIRLVINGVSGSPETSMGEIAFSVSQQVPEPTTILLFGTGLIGLAGARRKFKK